jgi:hypothetical protein
VVKKGLGFIREFLICCGEEGFRVFIRELLICCGEEGFRV